MKVNEPWLKGQEEGDEHPSDMPRYVQFATYADGSHYYRYNPPQEYVDAGVVRRVVLSSDRVEAFREADEYNNHLDEYRHEQSMKRESNAHDPTVKGLAEMYMESSFYEKLRPVTRDQYAYFINKLCKTEVEGKGEFGSMLYRDVTNGIAARVYDSMIRTHRKKGGDGIQMANHVLSVAKRIWSVANKWEVIHRNPWKHVETREPAKRRVKWTEEQVHQFLDTAFSRWEWRSVGVLCLLAYATAQRPGDLRESTWGNIRFDTGEYHQLQSKRGAEVVIPLEDNVITTLDDHYQDYGDQPYVAPHPRTKRPYELTHLSKTAQRIREAAGLPSELQLRDLRRTVASELADNGATEAEIMSWTGHKNPQSLKPYLKVSKAAARNALKKRRGTVD